MHIIVKMKFGSHLYGTHTQDSDVDYKGVFLPSKKEVLLNRIPKSRSFSTGSDRSKNRPDDVDIEIYSLHHFIQMAAQGLTVAVDMLHAPEEMLVESCEIWRSITSQRHRFYTKRLNDFVAYALRQASKYGIKGSRLDAVSQVLALLKNYPSQERLRRLWQLLPRNDHSFEIQTAPNGLRQYQVCGKIFQESIAVKHVVATLEKFYDAYGQRAKLAAHNKEIDWKAVSHALRAAYQIKEILTTGSLIYPLHQASYLKEIKSGRLDYLGQVAPVLEALVDEVQTLLDQSDLPDEPDLDFWNQFICETLESNLF